MTPATVLVCEPEADLAERIRRDVEAAGIGVVVSNRGADLLERLGGVDLVVLDVDLPDLSGIEVCRRVRRIPAHAGTPLILVSDRTDEIDRVVGFEVGADDYVTKPLSVRELVLRVRAHLRRAGAGRATAAWVQGRIRVDPDAHRVFVDDRELDLTPAERRLLLVLMTHAGRACTRETLISRTWGAGHQITERTVDTHVKRLRAKLGPAGHCVRTLRGVGYRWQDEA